MKISRFGLSSVFFAFALLPLSSPAYSAAPAGAPVPLVRPVLASHKALYSVTLTSVRPGGDYLDVAGKMFLEFTDKCDVWKTSQKSLLRTISTEGDEERSNSDFNASESKAGDLYTFSVKQTQGGDSSEFRGSASRNDPNASATAEYSQPEHKIYRLPQHFLFPTAQQIKIVESAQKGGHFFSGDIFDGSEGGGAAHFSAVILKPSTGPGPAVKNALLDSPSYRVKVAYFPPEGTVDHDASNGQPTADTSDEPEYEMTMTVHDNGVVSDYSYDYEDFSVHGKLVAIQSLPRPHC